ncbi:MAG: hypothetical protein K2P33_02930 [Acutalibacter sp.]|nr:hypothetical protein [Acutalibacter sp.]
MNSSRPSGPSGVSVDTQIMVTGGKKSEEQFYAAHSNEGRAKGLFGKIRALFQRKP